MLAFSVASDDYVGEMGKAADGVIVTQVMPLPVAVAYRRAL